MQRRTDLTAPRGLEWLRLWGLYLTSFPAAERKSIRRILRMRRDGRAKVWAIRRDGKFSGLLMTMESPHLVQLDYLTVCKKARNSGLGAEALSLLREKLAGRPLFVEIESPFTPGPDQTLRQRRRGFYLRAGMTPLHILAGVYEVEMELLGIDCSLTFQQYQNFYREYYNTWAAEHIAPSTYPN